MKKQYYFESGSSVLLFSLLSEKEKSQTIFYQNLFVII